MDEYEKWLVAKATGEFMDCDFGDNPKVIYKCGFIDGMLNRAELTLNKYRSMTCKMEAQPVEYTDSGGKIFRDKCDKCGYLGFRSYYCPNCGRRVVEEKNNG